MTKIVFKVLILIILLEKVAFAVGNTAPKAIITIQKGEVENSVPFSLNLDGSESYDPDNDKLSYLWNYPNGKTLDSKNPRSHRFEEAGNFTITLTVTDEFGLSDTATLQIHALAKSSKKSSKKDKYQNGDLSNRITISEIFPNPDGKDSNKEWLELYNEGSSDINLGNWKIINGKTITTIPDSLNIQPGEYLLLEGITIKNSNNTLNLLDFNEKIISSVSYEKSVENQSYSRIIIKNGNKQKTFWQWTDPTKGNANPLFVEIVGTIDSIATDQLILKTDKGSVNTGLGQINPQIIKTILSPGDDVQALIQQTIDGNTLINLEKSNQSFTAKTEPVTTPPHWYYILLFATIPMLIILKITTIPSRPSHYKSSWPRPRESIPNRH